MVRVPPASFLICHFHPMSKNSETWEFPVKADFLVPPEGPASLECLDVQVLRVVLALWVNWAGLALLVCPDHLVTPDPLVSLDPVENKVAPVQSVVLVLPAASAAASISASLW